MAHVSSAHVHYWAVVMWAHLAAGRAGKSHVVGQPLTGEEGKNRIWWTSSNRYTWLSCILSLLVPSSHLHNWRLLLSLSGRVGPKRAPSKWSYQLHAFCSFKKRAETQNCRFLLPRPQGEQVSKDFKETQRETWIPSGSRGGDAVTEAVRTVAGIIVISYSLRVATTRLADMGNSRDRIVVGVICYQTYIYDNYEIAKFQKSRQEVVKCL